jgi:hypothetical protein
MARMTKADRIRREIADQERWVAEHGGNETGYIERYGDPSVGDSPEEYYGEGGKKIFEADNNELKRLRKELAKVLEKR